MANTIKLEHRPNIDWFIDRVGPLRHWSRQCVIGHGWRVDLNRKEWSLTINDGKILTYWTFI